VAIAELRQAANRLQGRKEHHSGRGFLLLTGIVVGLLYNPFTGPETRKWLKEKVFGGGERVRLRQRPGRQRLGQ
jgi:hypothetical protein